MMVVFSDLLKNYLSTLHMLALGTEADIDSASLAVGKVMHHSHFAASRLLTPRITWFQESRKGFSLCLKGH